MKLFLALCLTTAALCSNPPSSAMKMVWSEEFKDAAIDEAKWTFEGDKQALIIKDGKLVITLRAGRVAASVRARSSPSSRATSRPPFVSP
jgi:hypothetical protein